MRKIIISAVAAAAVAIPGLAALSASGADAASLSYTASTAVSGRSDSGIHGNTWAIDAYNRITKVTRAGQVAPSYCGGASPCYHWTGSVKDTGTFTTQPGQLSPGAGGLNGVSEPTIGTAVTGPETGGASYSFYTTDASAVPAGMPGTVSGDGGTSTGNWVEQMFPAGTAFYDASGNTGGSEYLLASGGWTYTAGLGKDSACPNTASRWVDASASGWGASPESGNILAPDASGC
jgi:hypothetical protein